MIDSSIVTRTYFARRYLFWSYNCLFNFEFSIHLINLLLNKIWCLSTPPIAMGSFLISKLYLYLLENEDAYLA